MTRQPWYACALVCVLAVGCGEDELAPRIPAAIVVLPEEPRVPIHETRQLTATVVDSAGDAIDDQPLAFTSSNPEILTVSPTGLLAADGLLGQARITVTSGELTAGVDALAVLPLSAIVVSPRELHLQYGEQAELFVRVTDDLGEEISAAVSFRTTDANVVVVTAGGSVGTRGIGQAAIVVSSPGRADAQVPATVVQTPTSLDVTPTSVVIAPGGQQQLTAAVLDVFAWPIPDQPITYSSSDPAVATVSSDGLVQGVVAGSAVVTVRSGNLSVNVGTFVGTPPPGDIVGSTGIGGEPWGAHAGNGRYFATSDGRLFGGQGTGFTFPLAVEIGGQVFGVDANAAGTRAYVATTGTAGAGPAIAVVDLGAGTVIDLLHGTGTDTMRAVALSRDESHLFVGTGSGVERIDLATGAAAVVPGVVGGVTAFSRHPTAPLLYANMGDTSVVEIDTENSSAVRTFTVPEQACCIRSFQGTVVTPDGSRLYAVLDAYDLVSWDLATGAPGPRLTGGGGVGIGLSPDGQLIYVGRSGRVLIVDRASLAVFDTVVVGGFARRIAVRSDGVAMAVNSGGYVSFIK